MATQAMAEATEPAPGLSLSSQLAQTALYLGLVVGVILLLAWAMKKLNGLQRPGSVGLKLSGGISLGGRERLLVVEVEGVRLLLGVSPAGINKLHEMPPAKRPLDFKAQLREVEARG